MSEQAQGGEEIRSQAGAPVQSNFYISPASSETPEREMQGVGEELSVTYIPDGSESPVTVRGIVASNEGVLLILQDPATGELTAIERISDKIVSTSSLGLPEHQPHLSKVDTHDVISTLSERGEQGQPTFGIAIIQLREGEQVAGYAMACGRFGLEQIDDGYTVLNVTGSDEVSHRLDPRITKAWFAVTNEAEDIARLRSPRERIEIIDHDRGARIRLAHELLADPHTEILDNPKYYEYFQSNPDRARQLLNRWYGDTPEFDVHAVMAHIEADCGAEYIPLLADPGIALYSKEFLAFATTLKATNGSLPEPVELKRSFSEHLGTQTVFRGMMLDDRELDTVRAHGILAPALVDAGRATHVLQETLNPQASHHADGYPRSFGEEIVGRLFDFSDLASLTALSVSGYEVVSRSVGYHGSGAPSDSDKRMYVFRCELPKLSVIKMEGPFSIEKRPTTTLTIGESVFNEANDLEVEMFVPYHIPVGAIRGEELVSTPPPRWARN